ncbi:MAG: hypothetical protein AB1449_06525, partial [Chloroflexota bacterium]
GAVVAAEAARRAWEERRTERVEQALNEEQTRPPEAGWEADYWRYMEAREAQAGAVSQPSEDERVIPGPPLSDRLGELANGRDSIDGGIPSAAGDQPGFLGDVVSVVSAITDHVALEGPVQGEYRVPLVPTSSLTSTEYLVRYSVRVRTPAESPAVVVDPTTPRVSVPFGWPILGNWSYDFRDSALSITNAAPWSLPVPASGDSVAQGRWSLTIGIGNYDGEFGIRQSLNFDSRVTIDGEELTNTSTSVISTSRFRPQNILYELGVRAIGGLLVVAPWLSFVTGSAGLSTAPNLIRP